eukprot:XP_020401441.1 forkhead box protein L2-like [Zea mays]
MKVEEEPPLSMESERLEDSDWASRLGPRCCCSSGRRIRPWWSLSAAEIRLPVRPAASETCGGRGERSPERSARRSREARRRFGGRLPLHCSPGPRGGACSIVGTQQRRKNIFAPGFFLLLSLLTLSVFAGCAAAALNRHRPATPFAAADLPSSRAPASGRRGHPRPPSATGSPCPRAAAPPHRRPPTRRLTAARAPPSARPRAAVRPLAAVRQPSARSPPSAPPAAPPPSSPPVRN